MATVFSTSSSKKSSKKCDLRSAKKSRIQISPKRDLIDRNRYRKSYNRENDRNRSYKYSRSSRYHDNNSNSYNGSQQRRFDDYQTRRNSRDRVHDGYKRYSERSYDLRAKIGRKDDRPRFYGQNYGKVSKKI